MCMSLVLKYMFIVTMYFFFTVVRLKKNHSKVSRKWQWTWSDQSRWSWEPGPHQYMSCWPGSISLRKTHSKWRSICLETPTSHCTLPGVFVCVCVYIRESERKRERVNVCEKDCRRVSCSGWVESKNIGCKKTKGSIWPKEQGDTSRAVAHSGGSAKLVTWLFTIKYKRQ